MDMISTMSNNLYCIQCYSIFSFECNLISQNKKQKFFLSCLNEVLTIYKFVCGSVFLQAFKPTHGWHSALSPAAVFVAGSQWHQARPVAAEEGHCNEEERQMLLSRSNVSTCITEGRGLLGILGMS
jgi:hypothetical protein